MTTPFPSSTPTPTSASMTDILSKNKKASILLTQVEIHNNNFNNQYYNKLLQPLLKQSDYTLDQFVTQCNKSYANLYNTGLFEKIEFGIVQDEPQQAAAAQSASASAAAAAQQLKQQLLPVKAIIDLNTIKLTNAQLQSTFYDNGNAFNFQYENLNWLGNGESLQALLQLDRRSTKMKLVDLQYRSPFSSSTNVFINAMMSNNVNPWASHEQILYNTMIGLETILPLKNTAMVSGLSFNRRTITSVTDSASDIVKSNSGDSLKKSFILSGSWDTREYLSPESKFAINGSLIKIDNEISNDDENGNFIKSVVTASLLQKFTRNGSIALQLDSSFGGIASLSNQGKIHIQDKFFQGGIGSLPGFEINSTGPTDGGDYIGGNIFYNFKISTLYALPFLPSSALKPIRISNFINFGNVLRDFKDLKKSLTNQDPSTWLLDNNSTSCGIGLVYKLGPTANLNLNYNIPISRRITDTAKHGLEFSLSIASEY